MENKKGTILLCDADLSLSLVLTEYLQDRGFNVVRADNLRVVPTLLRQTTIDLLLLDIAQPAGNGFTLIRQLRAAEYTFPILVLSQRSDRTDILRAYELGADDYILKPYSIEVLVAKLRVWLARTAAPEPDAEQVVSIGEMTLDARRNTLGGKPLSVRKCRILLLLAQRVGQLVDRHRILREVWGKDDEFASRSLSVYITELRHAIAPTGYTITALPGRGYTLQTA